MARCLYVDKSTVMHQLPGLNTTLGSRTCERHLAWQGNASTIGHILYQRLVEMPPIEKDLEAARYAVTFNSNSGVDAALAGVPVVAMDEGSMAWQVAGHRIGEIVFPDREKWAHDLAFAQWDVEEITSGEAWEHLRCI